MITAHWKPTYLYAVNHTKQICYCLIFSKVQQSLPGVTGSWSLKCRKAAWIVEGRRVCVLLAPQLQDPDSCLLRASFPGRFGSAVLREAGEMPGHAGQAILKGCCILLAFVILRTREEREPRSCGLCPWSQLLK